MPSVWIEKYNNKHGRAYLVRWEIEIRDPKTGQIINYIRDSEHCGPNKPYAEDRKKTIRDELFQGKTRIKKRGFGLDLVTVLNRFLQERKGARAQNTYNNFIKPAVESFRDWKANCPVSMIEQQDFVDWRDYLLDEEEGEGLDPTTVNMRLRNLSTAFRWAVDQELLDAHPVKKLKGILPPDAPAGRYLSVDEIDKLLPDLPTRVRKACYLALHHGVRGGEAVNLNWKMIYQHSDPWEMEIRDPRAFGIQSGAAIKPRQPRIIQVHPHVREMLGDPKPSGEAIEGLTKDMIESHLAHATQRLSLGRVRYHDFRHTAATNFMWKHGDVFRLMHEFGWRSLSSAKVYQHYTRRQNVPEYRPFSQYFPSTTAPREAAKRIGKKQSLTEN